MVFESLSRRLSRVFNLRYCWAAALYSGGRFRGKFHIDCFAIGFVGEFEVGPVTLRGVGGTGTAGFAALHHPLQNRTFAEILDLFEPSSKFPEAVHVAVQRRIPLDRAGSALGNRNTWHCSYSYITVRIWRLQVLSLPPWRNSGRPPMSSMQRVACRPTCGSWT